MKKTILVFSLFVLVVFSSLAQKDLPTNLVKKVRILVKDSIELVENKKDLIKETKALIREVENLTKRKRELRFFNQSSKFRIGITFQPLIFRNYKKNYKKNYRNVMEGELITKPAPTKIFNGFALGLTFGKKINKYFFLKSELAYSTQSERFLSNSFLIDDSGRKYYIQKGERKRSFEQLKLSILLDHKVKLKAKSSWSLHPYLGGQIIFLTKFKHIFRSYQHTNNPYNPDINNEILKYEFINNSGIVSETTWDFRKDPVTKEEFHYPDKYYPFKRLLFGLVGGLEIEKQLSPKLALGFGCRYDYNLSITENKEYGTQVEGQYSHQRRIGMTFSILKTIN